MEEKKISVKENTSLAKRVFFHARKTFKKHKKIFIGSCIGISLALIVNFFVTISTISGSSMYPTYKDGEVVFIDNITKDFNNGDVVILNSPIEDAKYIKRICGVPNDTLEIKEGVLYRNGKRVEESYVKFSQSETLGKFTLRENQYWVMGDNRAGSSDSRVFGAIMRENIIGKVIDKWDFLAKFCGG